jgi:hypothetical protein
MIEWLDHMCKLHSMQQKKNNKVHYVETAGCFLMNATKVLRIANLTYPKLAYANSPI